MANFGFAARGIKFSFEERNIRIHYVAATGALIAGLVLNISPIEWVELFIMIALVISLEMVNTAIEIVVDMVCPDHNEFAGKAKDVAAGAVLIAAMAAVAVGLVIFIPKIMALYF